jgi:hypothetical protein
MADEEYVPPTQRKMPKPMAPNVEPKVEMADEECPTYSKGKCLKKVT